MKCEIAYYSRSGNTALLAEELAEMLSGEEISLTDLSTDSPSNDADIYLVGYGVNRGTVPLKVIETLELAAGRELILFVTCGAVPTDGYKDHLERNIQPFIPEDCSYHGMFLCAGQFSDEVIRRVTAIVDSQPEHPIKSLLAHQKRTDGHPNEKDLQNLREFVWEILYGN